MIYISTDQMNKFSDVSRKNFEKRLIDHLEKAYPEEIWNLSEHELIMQVQNLIDKAFAYGIVTEEDVATFIDISFELGEKINTDEQFSWIIEILSKEELDGQAKISMIEEILFL